MRDPARMLPIGPPFGGLVTNTAARALNPSDCIDCLNVHTKGGTIQKRPGSVFHSSLVLGAGEAVLQSIQLNNLLAIYKGTNQGAATLHNIVGQGGNLLYGFASARNLPWGVADLFGRLYLVTGDPSVSRKVYWDGAAYVDRRLGIVAPSAPPGTSDSGAGAMGAGTYSYRYSYYNSIVDVESALSPEGQITIAASHKVSVSPIAGPDAQVTHVRIYRMLVGTDAVWYRVATAPVSAYLDNTHNDSLSRNADTIGKEVGDIPPVSNIIARHQQRLWYGVGTFARDVRPSERNSPELVDPLGGYRVTDDDRDRLVVMRSAFGVLWCFNTDSIWVITGTDKDNFVASKVVAGVGCFARYSLVEIEGALFFADRKGVYRFDGQGIDRVSAAIDPTWESLFDLTAPDSIHAAFEPITRSYVITGNNNTTHLFDRNLAYQVDTGRWSIWNLAAAGMTTHTAGTTGSINRKRLHFAGTGPENNGTICVLKDGRKTDQGLQTDPSIDWSWQTPHTDFGTPRIKHGYFLHASFEPSAEVDAADVSYSLDYSPMTPLGQMQLDGRNHKPFVLGRMARTLSVRLSGSSRGTPNIAGLGLEADPIGAF